MRDKTRDNIQTLIYIAFWGILLFSATFPTTFSKNSFDYLIKPIDELFVIYLFPLAMIVILHLWDTVYAMLTTKNLDVDTLKKQTISVIFFLCLVLIFIVLSCSNYFINYKKPLFFTVWISLLFLKYFSIQLSKPSVIYLGKTT